MSRARRALGENTEGTVGGAHKADTLGACGGRARVRAVSAQGMHGRITLGAQQIGVRGVCKGRGARAECMQRAHTTRCASVECAGRARWTHR